MNFTIDSEWHCMGIYTQDFELCISSKQSNGFVFVDDRLYSKKRKICPECNSENFCKKYSEVLRPDKKFGPIRLTQCFNDEQQVILDRERNKNNE